MALTQEITFTAYTEEDAVRQALTQFEKVKKIVKLKAGFKPDKAKVLDRKMGAKKWVTKQYLYSFTAKGFDENNEETYLGMKLLEVMDAEATKAEAVARAKELAISTMKPITIRLVKVLETGNNIVADVIPNGGILGQYMVIGMPKSAGQIVEGKKQLKEQTESDSEPEEDPIEEEVE